MITAEQERAFYDKRYSGFLALPNHALAVNRDVMARTIENPAEPAYERRLLYGSVLRFLLSYGLTNRRVLDYGCGPADWGVFMATEGADVALLDLSPAAVELGMRRASASGVAQRVRGFARSASDLGCFADGEFDLVFASAALHHTLKYPNSLAELVRVIRRGGILLLAETYNNNPLLGWARRLRARIQNEEEEQGEEIILSTREIAQLRGAFRKVELTEMNLLAMGKRLLRGRFESGAVRGAVRTLEAIDRVVLQAAPSLKRYCGEVLVVAER